MNKIDDNGQAIKSTKVDARKHVGRVTLSQ